MRSSLEAMLLMHDLDLSYYLEGWDPTATRSVGDVKVVARPWVSGTLGHKRFAISLQAIYDQAEDGEDERVWAMFNSGLTYQFSHLPEGDVLGRTAYFGKTDLGSKQITAGEGPVKYPVAVVASKTFYRGKGLTPLDTKAATGTGTAVDFAAAAPTGAGGAVLHVTDIDVGATLTVVVEHSIDGNAWDTLGTFTTLAGVTGSQLLEFATTASVRRYIRERHTLAGGAATFFVAAGQM
jgi:hypothetical protein